MRSIHSKSIFVAALFAAVFAFSTLVYSTVRIELLAARLRVLEAAVGKRDDADPLAAPECYYARGACSVSFARLVSSPQQFHKREIMVTGIYIKAKESSALYDENSTRDHTPEKAIWFQGGLPNEYDLKVVTVIGRFKRGPSGHMQQYRGELDNVRIIGVEKNSSFGSHLRASTAANGEEEGRQIVES